MQRAWIGLGLICVYKAGGAEEGSEWIVVRLVVTRVRVLLVSGKGPVGAFNEVGPTHEKFYAVRMNGFDCGFGDILVRFYFWGNVAVGGEVR